MLDDNGGSVTPGKQEDIVLRETNAINKAPVVDPLGTVVVFSDTSNIDTVFVAGKAVKRHGELVGVDISTVIRRLEDSRDHILGAGGLPPDCAGEAAPLAL